MKSLSYWMAYILHLLLEKTYNWLDLIVFVVILGLPLWIFIIVWIIWSFMSAYIKQWYEEMKKPLPSDQ